MTRVTLYECRECKRPIPVYSTHATVDCHGIPAQHIGEVFEFTAERKVANWKSEGGGE